MFQDFRKFILRGNVVDLAVAVVIGAAFAAVVTSLVNNIVLSLIGGLLGKPSFDDALIVSTDGGDRVFLRIGAFLTDVANFVIIAAALFVFVKAFETLQERRRHGDVEEAPELTDEAELLTEIRDLLQGSDPAR